jgi:hypothetical protein
MVAAAVLLSASSGVLGGCGGGGSQAKSANVQAGDMPSGESWTGVYYHPVYGYLHLQETDTNVVGRWRRTDQSAWGELSGTKMGNVLRFTWKEHKYGLVGPSAETRGKGLFVYKMGDNNIPELDGSYGLDGDETGSDWHNVKQVNMKPDLSSISADPAGSPPPPSQQWE